MALSVKNDVRLNGILHPSTTSEDLKMENQIDVKVVKRDKYHEKGLFKKGAEITIDLDDMEAYHSGLTWNVRKCENGLFKLNGFETYMEII